MSRVLRSIRVTFTGEEIELAVTYAHPHEHPTYGTNKRTATAARMARKELEAASAADRWHGVDSRRTRMLARTPSSPTERSA